MALSLSITNFPICKLGSSYQKLTSELSTPCSAGSPLTFANICEWKHFLKQDLVEGLPQKVEKVASSTWSTALERLKVDMAEVWPASNCLQDFQLPIE